MNQKLIVVALGVAFAAAATPVLADTPSVQLVGRVQVQAGDVKIDGLSGNRHQRAIADNEGMSRFGFRINEDLGNGLSAVAFIDWRFGTGAGVGPIAREQWLGLSSKNLGTLTLGRINSTFKLYGHASYDPFVATDLQLRGSGGAMWAPADGFGAAAFIDHAVRYDSPKFGPFEFAAIAAPSNADQADPTVAGALPTNTGGKSNGTDYQVAGRFNFGMGEVVTGYGRDRANGAQRAAAAVNGKNADSEKTWMLGGKIKVGPFGFFTQYDHITNALASGSGGGTSAATTGIGSINSGGIGGCSAGASANSAGDAGTSTGQCNTAMNTNGNGNVWALGTNWTIGNTMLVLQGGRTEANSEGTAPERKARNITAGAVHSLSKRTTLFGGYQRVNVTTANPAGNNTGDRNTWSLGMRHLF